MNSESKNLETTNLKGNLALLLPIAVGIFLMSASWRVCLVLAGVSGAGWIWRYYHHQHQKRLTQLNSVFYQLIQENQGRLTTLDLAMKTQLPGDLVQKYLEKRAREFSANFEVTEQGGILYYFQTAQGVQTDPTLINLAETQPLDLSDHSDLDLKDLLPPEDSAPKTELSLPSFLNSSESVKSQILPPEIQAKLVSPKTVPSLPDEKIESVHPGVNYTNLIGLSQSDLAKRLQVHPNTISKRKSKADFSQWSREKDPESMSWHYSPETKKFYPQKVHQIQLPSFPEPQ